VFEKTLVSTHEMCIGRFPSFAAEALVRPVAFRIAHQRASSVTWHNKCIVHVAYICEASRCRGTPKACALYYSLIRQSLLGIHFRGSFNSLHAAYNLQNFVNVILHHEPCLGETWRLSHAKVIQATVLPSVSIIAGGEPTICPFRTQFVPVGVEYFSC
jgi:hypothetical protein